MVDKSEETEEPRNREFLQSNKTKRNGTEQENFSMRHEYKIIIGIQLSEFGSMCVIYD